MNLKRLSFLVIVLVSQASVGQGDTLNRSNVKGEKTGWWIVYVDEDLSRTDDTLEARFAVYSWFEDDFEYFKMGRIGTRKQPVIAPAVKPNTNWTIPPLDGKFIAKHKNGTIRFEVLANEGRLTYFKEYYKNGILKTHFDFTESCGDTAQHYSIFQYDKDGELKYKGTLKTP